jgi:hypothetical protein
MAHRYFTVEEAEHLVPKVRRHMTKLMTIHDELSALSGVKVHSNDFDWKAHLLAININKRFHELSFKYFAELEAITQLGCYVKDVQQGLVDFYSKFEDKDLVLSWQYDEPNVLYFHEEHATFEERQPVELLKKKLAEEREALI